MGVTQQQRRAAFIALMLTASAGGGYVAKDELIAIGQRYCGPVPKAVLELRPPDAERYTLLVPSGDATATPEHLQVINDLAIKNVKVRLDLGKAQGLLAQWCDPDRQQLQDTVTTKLMKGNTQ